MWHDRWDENQAIGKIISKRVIYAVGFNDNSSLRDLIDENG